MENNEIPVYTWCLEISSFKCGREWEEEIGEEDGKGRGRGEGGR